MDKTKLYHYSNNDIKDIIDPKFFGANSYTFNSGRISGVKRAYFYLTKSGREYFLNGCRFLYIAEINKSRLYNLNKDILNLTGRYTDIYKEVKNRGYKGLIGNNGFISGVLFYPIKIKSRIRLIK